MAVRLGWLIATDNRRSAVIIPLWGLALTAVYAQAIYQRAYLTLFDYALAVAVCGLAGAITVDLGRALANYIGAMAIGVILLFILTVYPANSSVLPSPGDIIFQSLWISVVFTNIFPLPFIGYLVASVVGAGLGEKYL